MKRVLITGATRGIGLELVRLCAERGDLVFAGCRSVERAVELEKLSAEYPGKVIIIQMDIGDDESLERSGALVAARVEGLDLLLNNAAIHADGETIRTFSGEEALKLVQINAVSQILVAKRFLDLLVAGRDAKIVNVSSESGSVSQMTGFRGYYYFGSKAALNMYTRALAWDPEARGITVIALHPGWVRTDMGGEAAPILPAESAAGILRVADGLSPEDNGKFLTWDGREYPW